MPYIDLSDSKGGFVQYSHSRGEKPGTLRPGEVAVNLADQSIYVGTSGGDYQSIMGVGDSTFETVSTATRIATIIPAGHVVIDATSGVAFIGNGVSYGGLPVDGSAGWMLSGQPLASGVGPDGKNLTGLAALTWHITAAASRNAYKGDGTPVAMTKNGSYILTHKHCSTFSIFHTQGAGNTVIDWGDGGGTQTLSASTFGTVTKTYASPGQYLISWTENSNPARIELRTPPLAVYKWGDANAWNPVCNAATGLAPVPSTSRTWANGSYLGMPILGDFGLEYLRLAGPSTSGNMTVKGQRVATLDVSEVTWNASTGLNMEFPSCSNFTQVPADRLPCTLKGCTALRAAGFPANGFLFNASNKTSTFDGCKNLKGTRTGLGIKIASGVDIGIRAFYDTNIDIEPETLDAMIDGYKAWGGCDFLGRRTFTLKCKAGSACSVGPFPHLSGKVTLQSQGSTITALGFGVDETNTDLEVILDYGAARKIRSASLFEANFYVPMWGNGRSPTIKCDAGGAELLELDGTVGTDELMLCLGRPACADFAAATIRGLGDLEKCDVALTLFSFNGTDSTWPTGELPFGLGWMRLKGNFGGNPPFWNIMTTSARWFSTPEYDKLLNSLAKHHQAGLWTASGGTMHFGASRYSDGGVASRNYLTNLGLSISDGGKA